MKEIDKLINTTSHRPWTIPRGRWNYYQEWNDVLFLHWKVKIDDLAPLIPKGILLDTFNGESWISIVAFTMEKIRPRNLPSLKAISDFHEINTRTYVTQDNKSGVYFLSIEAEKQISCIIANLLSGLPYRNANIRRQTTGDSHQYALMNNDRDLQFNSDFTVGERIANKSDLDNWLTERYCLYLAKDQQVFRYETHHRPWELHEVKISSLNTNYKTGNIAFNRLPDLAHFSAGVKVLAWSRTRLNTPRKN